MTRTQLAAVAAIPMIALALAFPSARPPQPAVPVSKVAGAPSDGSLRREIADLRQDISELQDDQDGLHLDLDAVSEPVGDPPVGEAPEVDPVKEMQDHMEQVTDAEAPDPAWSEDAEARIADRFAARAPEGAELVEMKCLTTVCRIEIGLGPRAEDGTDDAAVAAASPWDANFFYVTEPGPNGRVVAYVAREGLVLPRL